MTSPIITVIIVVAAVAVIGFLFYSQNQNKPVLDRIENMSASCPSCSLKHVPAADGNMNINIDTHADPYADPIKRQDLYSMNDPLTYPQLRLPREVLEKYQEYYDRTGEWPNFYQHHKPMFDNPILNGYLIKQADSNDPFADTSPVTVPIFRVKSMKNTNRFYYYIIDQRNQTDLKLKIPLENVKVNGKKYSNGEFYGLPELYDGDIIEDIPIYPNSKFMLMLYKNHSYP